MPAMIFSMVKKFIMSLKTSRADGIAAGLRRLFAKGRSIGGGLSGLYELAANATI
jgi:hypothetical protein